MKNVKFIGILFIIHSVFSGYVNAQVIENQVMEIGGILRDDGYSLTHSLKMESLRQGEDDYFNFILKSDWEYKVITVCDKDCEDIDICIYDENGNKINCDEEVDSMPIVEIRPRWTGDFKVVVDMYHCDINPCEYGIAIFGRLK